MIVKILQYAIPALACVASSSILYAEPLNDLSISLSGRKKAVFPGEPCLLEIVLHNKGPATLEFDLGSDAVEAYAFEILDSQKRSINRSSRIKTGGLSRLGRRKIEAKGAIEETVVLNRWCSTDLKPGMYQIVCRVHVIGGVLINQCPLEILQMDELKLRNIFSQLADTVVSKTNFQAKWSAFSMLSSTDAPFAVEPLWKVFVNSDQIGYKRDALVSLGKIGSLDAVRRLVSIWDSSQDTMEDFRPLAYTQLSTICQGTDDPKIIEICRRILQNDIHRGTGTPR